MSGLNAEKTRDESETAADGAVAAAEISSEDRQ